MNVYMDELPYNCDCCPCNDDYYRCGLSGDLFDEHDIDIGRMKNCKLKRLADVRENVRGYWKKRKDKPLQNWYQCSNCGAICGETPKYCSECGADMRGES